MSKVNTGKKTKEEDQQSLDDLVKTEISQPDTELVEREGAKYLTRHINGLTIETRIA